MLIIQGAWFDVYEKADIEVNNLSDILNYL